MVAFVKRRCVQFVRNCNVLVPRSCQNDFPGRRRAQNLHHFLFPVKIVLSPFPTGNKLIRCFQMMHRWAVVTALSLLALALSTPLDDYVNRPDVSACDSCEAIAFNRSVAQPHYKWSNTGLGPYRGEGWTGYVLNMTSQAWLNAPQDWHRENDNSNIWW